MAKGAEPNEDLNEIEGTILRELSYYNNIEHSLLIHIVKNKLQKKNEKEVNDEKINVVIKKLLKKYDIELVLHKEDDQNKINNKYFEPYQLSLGEYKYHITDNGFLTLEAIENRKKNGEKYIKKVFLRNAFEKVFPEDNFFNLSDKIYSYEIAIEEMKKDIQKESKSISRNTKANEITRKELEQIQSQFYGRIIEIFSIFVAIFGFIIVGFTQIPAVVSPSNSWFQNLLNASTVFIPIALCIIILIITTNRFIIQKLGKNQIHSI